jgi:hypothetical protein
MDRIYRKRVQEFGPQDETEEAIRCREERGKGKT